MRSCIHNLVFVLGGIVVLGLHSLPMPVGAEVLKQQSPPPAFVPNQVIVEFRNDDGIVLSKDDPTWQKMAQRFGFPQIDPVFSHLGVKDSFGMENYHRMILNKYPARSQRRSVKDINAPALHRFFKLTFAHAVPVPQVVDLLRASRLIKSVSPNHLLKTNALPNDPYFSSSASWGQTYDDLWGLTNINVEAAWNFTTGDPNLIMGVVDTGVDITHLDLGDNYYTNPLEIAGDGADDDGNGYIDDVNGYDFHNLDADPADDYGHGTHVAGTIAAQGNNGVGVTGVMWDAQVLPVKVCDASGSCAVSAVAEGIVYATDMGASVINLSLGGSGSSAFEAAIQYAYGLGTVIVASAGNESSDTMSSYPAAYKEVIAVASSTHDDTLSDFSNYGAKIDVAAPGGDSEDASSNAAYRNILSLRANGTDMYADSEQEVVGSDYYRARGTSMAAPHVVGLAGLILSADPTLTVEEVRQIIRISADDIEDPNWDTKTGFGRINARRALLRNTICEGLMTSPENNDISINSDLDVTGYASGRDFHHYRLRLGVGEPTSVTWLVAYSSLTSVAGTSLGTFSTADFSAGDGVYTLMLTVRDDAGHVCGRDIKMFRYSSQEAAYSFDGETGSLGFGSSLDMGDVNGDGKDDLLAGAPGCMPQICKSALDTGKVYLVYGGTSGLAEDTPIGDTGLVTVSWLADNIEDRLGLSVKIVNIDGDGYGDVLLGAPGNADNGTESGDICIFLGKNHATWTTNMSPSSADYCFYGEAAYDRMGYFVDSDDFDGDGLDDIATSACGNDSAGIDYGAVYVLYAQDAGSWVTTNNVNSARTILTGTASTTINCNYLSTDSSFEGAGLAVATAGDFDGDGMADLIIGEASANGYDGTAYLLNGSAGGITSGSLASAPVQFEEDEIWASFFGMHVAGAGDVNNDGYGDILVGHAYGPNDLFDLTAGSRLFLGSSSYAGIYPTSTSTTAMWTDMAEYNYGYRVFGLGDIDGDLIDDMAMGAFGYDPDGIVYVFLGTTTGFSSGLYLMESNLILAEDSAGYLGWAVTSGDFDGDGDLEVSVGATFGAGTVFIY